MTAPKPQDILHMLLYRPGASIKNRSDFIVAFAGGDPLHNFPFARRQRMKRSGINVI